MSEASTTVVISTRNRADILLRTLEALLELDPQPPIIVLDDDSRDDTVERLHQLHDCAANLRIVRMRSDVPAVARNLGADLARTPFVAFCAEEMTWAADALSAAETLFERYPNLGAITARVLDPATGDPDPLCAQLAELPTESAQQPGPSVLRMHTGAMIVRRHAYVDCGGFDPMLHLAQEETLLACDFAARGWDVCYVDDVLAYRTAAEVSPRSIRARELRCRDELVMAWLRRPVRACARIGAALLRDATHDAAATMAVFGALRRFTWAMVEREPLPSAVEQRIHKAERVARARR